ncbi:MAG: hypothetical protein IPP79_20675 [Chitinophagaceae bacterium]|nr:hypothetical protein [Chitinophagaceae bacterium]
MKNADQRFEIWSYGAFILAYKDFKASGYPHTELPETLIAYLQGKMENLALPETFRPDDKNSLIEAFSQASKFLESSIQTFSSRINIDSNLWSQVLEISKSLENRKILLYQKM